MWHDLSLYKVGDYVGKYAGKQKYGDRDIIDFL